MYKLFITISHHIKTSDRYSDNIDHLFTTQSFVVKSWILWLWHMPPTKYSPSPSWQRHTLMAVDPCWGVEEYDTEPKALIRTPQISLALPSDNGLARRRCTLSATMLRWVVCAKVTMLVTSRNGFNVVYDVKYRLIERTDEMIKTQLSKNIIIIISSLIFCFI